MDNQQPSPDEGKVQRLSKSFIYNVKGIYKEESRVLKW